MKLAVIGATGMVGSRVTAEALRRGHDVTAVSRSAPQDLPAGARRVAADVAQPEGLKAVLAAADAAVLAIRPAPGDEGSLAPLTAKLLDAAAGMPVLVVGGAGPLRSPAGGLVVDDPVYVPRQWRAIAVASCEQLAVCESHFGDTSTYLSPPALLAPGERTGTYRRGGDTLLVDPDGRSLISVEDLAVAVLDEIETPSGVRHLTVAY
ncbi:NAD(P)H-binding protein [Streptomyces sp. TRM66268-LWL]|uniref:NAD(P)H-binding protein n=1 Tax=Streptomyces polyasparticus TaxID=2767826 RepID=A0ABR7SUJ1_9ACTN|nr:NAD(P)H-binding protein [Streptomyces polyasparticus]MBC9718272.1 NAD(P)H-binding protein [Streptomyces polyasparticus]